MRKQAASQHIAICFNADLGAAASPQWAGDLMQMPFVGSTAMKETAFFHRTSRTLMLADLIENFETAKFPSRSWAGVMKLTGIAYPDDKAPANWRATFKDKTTIRTCPKQMLDQQPEKIILAHGRCYGIGDMGGLCRAFRQLNQPCGGCFVEK